MVHTKDWAKAYEYVVKKAFGGIGRCGDPASIASTSAFCEGNLNSVKAGLGYVGAILSSKAWSRGE